MKMWKLGGFGLAMWLASNAGARAQGIPGVGVPPPPPPPGAAAVAGQAAGAGNIWSKLCLTEEQKAKCKERLCKLKLIQLMSNSLAPASALTGGIVGGCCPPVTATDLAKPATSAEGAAARIKKDEAEAKARREAVRYLGTVDCRYWPEAQEALINGLRADRNECVRWESAMSLGRGCCCTKPTIMALIIAISCSNQDGNPIEKSPRVRGAARAALERCVACYVEVNPVAPGTVEKPPVETPEEPKEKNSTPGSGKPATPNGNGNTNTMTRSQEYYERVKRIPRSQLIAEARKTLEKHTAPVIESDVPPSGSRSVFEVISHITSPQTVEPGSSYEVVPASVVVKDAIQGVPPVHVQATPVATPPPPVARPNERLVPQALPPSVKTPSSTTVKPVGATSSQAVPVVPAKGHDPELMGTVPPAVFAPAMPPQYRPTPKPVARPVPGQVEQPRRSRVGRPVTQVVPARQAVAQ